MSMKTLASRIQYLGGDQISRMNKRKVESLRLAMKNSYNTRMIKVGNSAWPCLINTMTGGRKANYEKDMISVEYAAGLEPGDTFEMLDTGVHWMVYLPVITETAYLKSEIIRCRYSLEINEKKYWVAVTGPQETDLRWLIKKNINANELNLSGVVYIKNDENTKKFFKRFTRIKLDGHTWEVQVTDSLTVPGIIELNIQEYYDNTIEELPEIKRDEDNTELNVISGKTMVKQDTIVGYAINDLAYDPKAEWHVENNPRVKIEEVLEDGRICKVRIFPGAIKTFDLYYGKEQFITVTVDWAKPVIQGPDEVRPYDTHTYWVKGEDRKVKFRIQSDLAEIIDADDSSCKVDITTGRSGKFVIECLLENGEITSLPVEIKSL